VLVRTAPNAEVAWREARVDRADDYEAWWRASVPVAGPVLNYRFLLVGGFGYRWLTAEGVVSWDPTDATDFRLVTFDPPPAWVRDAVFYQIFPDRFAASGALRDTPAWARRADWDEPVRRGGRRAMQQLYGGDLGGIEAHLDHLHELGVNALYLTPFFPAPSNHRYNASSFDVVDPLLGGDEALASMVRAMHGRGIRVVGDLTANHCGSTHPWFLEAREDPASVEASFFFPKDGDFEYWFGVRSLPKLDHRSRELRRRLYDGPRSSFARWLKPPYELDGWRIDVANMAGRMGEVDLNHVIATTMRRTMARVRPDAYLVAEHGHDPSGDLMGDGWHGTMAYSGFTQAAYCFLNDPERDQEWGFIGAPMPMPLIAGGEAARSIDAFRAAIPWRSWTHNLNLLGSHDTPRWRTVAGSRERAIAGAGMLLTFPGIPSIFAGDEVGVEGVDSEDARRPMPWDRGRWDLPTWTAYRALISLRRSRRALRHGGFRWAHVDDDVLVYLRETRAERLLVQISRGPHRPVILPSMALGLAGPAEPLLGGPSIGPRRGTVELPGNGPAVHVWAL
jgi:alpha-glucosidase